MNALEYQKWMKKAFLAAEAALTSQIATPSASFVSEDFIRSALLRGLVLTNSKQAHRVECEEDVAWNYCADWKDNSLSPKGGRPIQHDVAVSKEGEDKGLVCEVKWLKHADASTIAKDIWKLALTRSTDQEAKATRTYLLVGGTMSALSQTLATLRKNRLNLRWSKAGRGKNELPRATKLELYAALGAKLGFKAWREIITWGSAPKKYRRSPGTWAALRASVRCRWVRAVEGVSWRLVLWELDHWGVDPKTMDWDPHYSKLYQ